MNIQTCSNNYSSFKFLLFISIFAISLASEQDNSVNNSNILKLNRETLININENKVYEIEIYYKKFNVLLTDLKNIKSVIISDNILKENKCDSNSKVCFESKDIATNLFQNSCVNKLYIYVILNKENTSGSLKINVTLSTENCILENSGDIDMCLTKNTKDCFCKDSCEVVSCGNFSNNKFVRT